MTKEVRLAAVDIKKSVLSTPVTMQSLWRVVVWGSTAATAMLIAVLASRGVVGSQRAAIAASTLSGSPVVAANTLPSLPVNPAANPTAMARANKLPERPFDPETETKRLSDAVVELTADNDQLKSRLAAIEHDVDDVTGSIAQQVETAKTATPPWPDQGPPVPATPAAIAAIMAPSLPIPMAYGVDIGSGLSIEALRARWAGMRSAHAELLDGLRPSITLKETPRSKHPELRLIIGPFASAHAATQLCAALAPYRLFCEPTIFTGQHLALE
jgi:hypothetical protein